MSKLGTHAGIADDDESFEYIVVGSGAGGAPVACRLAEADHRVVLLEAGGAPDLVDERVPAFHTAASEHDAMSWKFFVRHYADEQQQGRDWKYTPERGGVFYPRAGTLGGCTAHHAMIIAVPQPSVGMPSPRSPAMIPGGRTRCRAISSVSRIAGIAGFGASCTSCWAGTPLATALAAGLPPTSPSRNWYSATNNCCA